MKPIYFVFFFFILCLSIATGFIPTYNISYRIGGNYCDLLDIKTREPHPYISDGLTTNTLWTAKTSAMSNITYCFKTNETIRYAPNSFMINYDVGNSAYWNDYSFYDNSTGILSLISHHNSTSDNVKFGNPFNTTVFHSEFTSNDFCLVLYNANYTTVSGCSMANVKIFSAIEISVNSSSPFLNNSFPIVNIPNLQSVYCYNYTSKNLTLPLNMTDADGDVIYYSYANYVENYLYITEYTTFDLNNHTADYSFFTDGRFISNGTYNTDQIDLMKDFYIMEYIGYTSLFFNQDSPEFYLVPKKPMLRNSSFFMGMDITNNGGLKITYYDLSHLSYQNISIEYDGNLTISKNSTVVLNKQYTPGNKFYINTNYTNYPQICFSTGDNLQAPYCIDFDSNRSLSMIGFSGMHGSGFRMIYYGFGGDQSSFEPDWITYQPGISQINYNYKTSVMDSFDLELKITDSVHRPDYKTYDFPIMIYGDCALMQYNQSNNSLIGVPTLDYINAIDDGPSKFNTVFYLLIFGVFIFVVFQSQSLELSLIITGLCGLAASWIISKDLVQMISSGSLIAVGIAVLIAKVF